MAASQGPELSLAADVFDEYSLRREVLAFATLLKEKRPALMAELPVCSITWLDLDQWCHLAGQDFPNMLARLHAMEGIPETESVMRSLADKGCGIQFRVPPGDVDGAAACQRQQHVRTHMTWGAVKPRKLANP